MSSQLSVRTSSPPRGRAVAASSPAAGAQAKPPCQCASTSAVVGAGLTCLTAARAATRGLSSHVVEPTRSSAAGVDRRGEDGTPSNFGATFHRAFHDRIAALARDLGVPATYLTYATTRHTSSSSNGSRQTSPGTSRRWTPRRGRGSC